MTDQIRDLWKYGKKDIAELIKLRKKWFFTEDRKTDNWKLTDGTDHFSSKWQFLFKENKGKWGWKSQYSFLMGKTELKRKTNDVKVFSSVWIHREKN